MKDKYIHLGGGENCRLLKGYLLLKGRFMLRFADQEAEKAFQGKATTMNKAETSSGASPVALKLSFPNPSKTTKNKNPKQNKPHI